MKTWKRLLVGTTLLIGTSVVGLAQANAVSCTVTDPNAAGTTVGVARGDNSTTVTAEPGAAALPTVTCSGLPG